MEYYWTFLRNSTNGSCASNGVRGHNGNCTATSNPAWESSLDLIGNNNDINNNGGGRSSRVEYCNYPPFNPLDNCTPTTGAGIALHGPAVQEREKSAGGHLRNTDPPLTCTLNLGKRHYFEDVAIPPTAELHAAAAEGSSSNTAKKGKHFYGTTGGPLAPALSVADVAPAVVPCCQVEGCETVLVNAKEYHRRHRVCEMHAKAPRVVVLGIEQRFCQQCSRFHAVGEFDESKRSCRRRLAGHNERRRKSSQEQHSLARKHSQDSKMMATGTHPHFMNRSECALSLLSSSIYNPSWNISPPSDDLPARCGAALRELIAENRASVLACTQAISSNKMENCNDNTHKPGWIRACPGPSIRGGHATLDLMQDPDSAFGLLSMHDHKKASKGDEDCSELWKVPLGY